MVKKLCLVALSFSLSVPALFSLDHKGVLEQLKNFKHEKVNYDLIEATLTSQKDSLSHDRLTLLEKAIIAVKDQPDAYAEFLGHTFSYVDQLTKQERADALEKLEECLKELVGDWEKRYQKVSNKEDAPLVQVSIPLRKEVVKEKKKALATKKAKVAEKQVKREQPDILKQLREEIRSLRVNRSGGVGELVHALANRIAKHPDGFTNRVRGFIELHQSKEVADQVERYAKMIMDTL